MSLATSACFWKEKGRGVTEVNLVCLVEFVLLLPRTFIICPLNYLGRVYWLVTIGPLGVATRSRHHPRGIGAKFRIVLVVYCVVKTFLVDRGARRLLTMVAFRRVSRLFLLDCVLERVKVRSEVVINWLLLAMLAAWLTFIAAFVRRAG